MKLLPSRSLVWLIVIGTLAALAIGTYTYSLPEKYTGEMQAVEENWYPEILRDGAQDFLPDFSFAGYLWGEADPPRFEVNYLVTDFGAIPNDGIDDTDAIKRALSAAHLDTAAVTIGFPPGRFIVTDILFLERSNIVIQGAGSGGSVENGTVLFVPEPLKVIANEKAEVILSDLQQYLIDNGLRNLWRPYSLYAWSGGIIWTRSPDEEGTGRLLASASGGLRGQFDIHLTPVTSIRAGDVVEIAWFNTEGKRGSLLRHILGNYDLPIGDRLFETPEKALIVQPVTVLSVDEGHIGIKEPLLHDIRPEWKVTLRSTAFLEQVGIEHLSIEFPPTTYAGHHLDAGYNGIYLSGTAHSWVRDVHVHHADTAILTSNSKNITVSALTVSGRKGHHSVYVSNSYGFLTRDFVIESDALHNPSFNTGSTLSVFTHGRIDHAVLDQHGGLNHQNLYDDIVTQDTRHLMDHGGARYWFPTAGRFNTFWNIVAEEGGDYTGVTRYAPDARIVGLRGPEPKLSIRYGPSPYIEGLNQTGLLVPSLYEYQLNRRTQR